MAIDRGAPVSVSCNAHEEKRAAFGLNVEMNRVLCLAYADDMAARGDERREVHECDVRSWPHRSKLCPKVGHLCDLVGENVAWILQRTHGLYWKDALGIGLIDRPEAQQCVHVGHSQEGLVASAGSAERPHRVAQTVGRAQRSAIDIV